MEPAYNKSFIIGRYVRVKLSLFQLDTHFCMFVCIYLTVHKQVAFISHHIKFIVVASPLTESDRPISLSFSCFIFVFVIYRNENHVTELTLFNLLFLALVVPPALNERNVGYILLECLHVHITLKEKVKSNAEKICERPPIKS